MKIYKLSEDSRPITLYHISNESITMLSPKSSFFGGYKGLYFSPSYRSLIRDWAPYVRGRKNRHHLLLEEAERIRKICREKDEKKEDSSNEQEKLDKIQESISNSELQESNKTGYKTLYIYRGSVKPSHL